MAMFTKNVVIGDVHRVKRPGIGAVFVGKITIGDLAQALKQARDARLTILEVMAEAMVGADVVLGLSTQRWRSTPSRWKPRRSSTRAEEALRGRPATDENFRAAAEAGFHPVKLNTVLSTSVAWIGADEIVALTVPERRGPAPVFDAPSGPAIQESMGRTSPERTLITGASVRLRKPQCTVFSETGT